jgi:hypothetical protein
MIPIFIYSCPSQPKQIIFMQRHGVEASRYRRQFANNIDPTLRQSLHNQLRSEARVT